MSRNIKASPNQRIMFEIDDTDNVTYYFNGRPQTLEQLINDDSDFEDIDLLNLEDELKLAGYGSEIVVEQNFSAIEKEDDKTVQISISDLEKIKKILTAIPQFRNLAAERNQEVESIEFLAQAVTEVDFMSLPHFEVDMSIFDILTKNNPDYRDFVFSNVMYLVNQVGITKKFPSRKYLHNLFIDFTPVEIDIIYSLLKRMLGMLNSWGGMQIHTFEQTVRDWMYLVYEEGCGLDQEQIFAYLQKNYPCKPSFEIYYIAQMLFNAIQTNATLDQFIQEFFNFMECFTPEENIFLTSEEVHRLWISDFLKNRIFESAEKWRHRIADYKIVDPNNELDSFFGVNKRLSQRIRQGILPSEVYAEDSIDEALIKYKFYFEEGHRAYIEARVDRITRVNGQVNIYDWKTTKKEFETLNDFEKLQIILQCLAVQNLMMTTTEGKRYKPFGDDDYKFFPTEINTKWLNVSNLPNFSHIPEVTEELMEYVMLNVTPEEIERLLKAFSSIVNFLICNKKPIAKIRRLLKNIDSYISAPKLVAPVVNLESIRTPTGTEG